MNTKKKNAWGKAADAIALVNAARANGQDVTADQYPYTASSTSLLATVIPPQYREGSAKDFLARLDDAEQGPKLRAAIAERLTRTTALRISAYGKRVDWQGKDIDTIAKLEKKQPVDICVEILRNGGAQIVNFNMSDEDMRLIMKQPFVATASDGSAAVPSATVPHPRSYGCFPRKVGR